MPQGFRLNPKTVAKFLKNDEGGKAKIREVAERIRAQAGPEARVEEYTTDRAVAGVVVPADAQAKHGAATRAANAVVGRRGQS